MAALVAKSDVSCVDKKFIVFICITIGSSVCLLVFGVNERGKERKNISSSNYSDCSLHSSLLIACGSVYLIFGIVSFIIAIVIRCKRDLEVKASCLSAYITNLIFSFIIAISFFVLLILMNRSRNSNGPCVDLAVEVITYIFCVILAFSLVCLLFSIISFWCGLNFYPLISEHTRVAPSQQHQTREAGDQELIIQNGERAPYPQRRNENEHKIQIQKNYHQKRSKTSKIHPLSVNNVVDSDFVEWI